MFWRHTTSATKRAVSLPGATATLLSRVWYVCIRREGVFIVAETQTVPVRLIVCAVLAAGRTKVVGDGPVEIVRCINSIFATNHHATTTDTTGALATHLAAYPLPHRLQRQPPPLHQPQLPLPPTTRPLLIGSESMPTRLLPMERPNTGLTLRPPTPMAFPTSTICVFWLIIKEATPEVTEGTFGGMKIILPTPTGAKKWLAVPAAATDTNIPALVEEVMERNMLIF